MSWWLLFFSAFGAATILPFSSEIVLLAMLTTHSEVFLVWLTATIGNTLGACVNWLLGRYLAHFEQRRWFPVKPEDLHRAQRGFQRYGSWSLLFTWLPVVGDALTFVAGLMRVRFLLFLLLTAVGKGLRYAVVIALYQGVA